MTREEAIEWLEGQAVLGFVDPSVVDAVRGGGEDPHRIQQLDILAGFFEEMMSHVGIDEAFMEAMGGDAVDLQRFIRKFIDKYAVVHKGALGLGGIPPAGIRSPITGTTWVTTLKDGVIGDGGRYGFGSGGGSSSRSGKMPDDWEDVAIEDFGLGGVFGVDSDKIDGAKALIRESLRKSEDEESSGPKMADAWWYKSKKRPDV